MSGEAAKERVTAVLSKFLVGVRLPLAVCHLSGFPEALTAVLLESVD